jgi:squalene cyclase
VLQALILFQELYPGYRTKEIETSIRNAATFIERRQQEDGSWFALMHHLIRESVN